MTISSGFFDSVSNDRVYSSTDFNTLLGGVITDGIFQNVGGALMVTDGTDMEVIVADGRAWFLDTWLDNSAALALPIAVSSAGFDRIDVIALDFNSESATRENSIVVIQGTAAASPVAPALIDTALHKQVALAHVLIPASSTEVTQANITNKVGLTEAPFVTSVLTSQDASALVAQWEAEFDVWFANIQAQLAGNVATNLQNQIDTNANDIDGLETDTAANAAAIAALPDAVQNSKGRNLLVNGDMAVMQRGAWAGNVKQLAGYKPGIPDRWKIVANMDGLFSANILPRTGMDGNWFEIECITTSPQGWNGGAGYLILEQLIEGWRTADVGFGTPEEKDVTLSFKTKGNYVGVYYVQVTDGTNTRYYQWASTLSNTEETISIQLEKGVYSHDYDNELGLTVRMWFGSGNSRFVATERVVTFMGIAGNKLAITDVQLEINETHSQFERLDYDSNLLACQRYYEVYDRDVILHNTSFQVEPNQFNVLVESGAFATVKRAVPTLSGVSIYSGRNVNGTPITSFTTAEEYEHTSTTTYRTKSTKTGGIFYGELALTINPDWPKHTVGVLQFVADAEL